MNKQIFKHNILLIIKNIVTAALLRKYYQQNLKTTSVLQITNKNKKTFIDTKIIYCIELTQEMTSAKNELLNYIFHAR